MKANTTVLLILLTLTVLFSCARAPQQIAEGPVVGSTLEEGSRFVVRIEGRHGAASGFFVEPDKIATNIHVVAQPGPIFIKSRDKKKIWTVEGVTAFDVKNDLAILKIASEGTPLYLATAMLLQSGIQLLPQATPMESTKSRRGLSIVYAITINGSRRKSRFPVAAAAALYETAEVRL